MSNTAPYHNEASAAAAFTKQAPVFDALYSSNIIIQYKRERVRHHLQTYLRSGSHILELNSGTGEDAVWLAQQGHYVHATDIAAGMQQQLQQKIIRAQLEAQITTEQISFTQLQHLKQQRQYDHIFSNFVGLNCTDQLDKATASFNALLKPGGVVTLVLLPGFCLWEFLLLFKGRFKAAFRRMCSSKGVTAHIEGTYFTCWYYNPLQVVKSLGSSFEVLDVEGLCTLVPPSYLENFPQKHPALFQLLKRAEEKHKRKWPWRFIGDYYIISLRKKG